MRSFYVSDFRAQRKDKKVSLKCNIGKPKDHEMGTKTATKTPVPQGSGVFFGIWVGFGSGNRGVKANGGRGEWNHWFPRFMFKFESST